MSRSKADTLHDMILEKHDKGEEIAELLGELYDIAEKAELFREEKKSLAKWWHDQAYTFHGCSTGDVWVLMDNKLKEGLV